MVEQLSRAVKLSAVEKKLKDYFEKKKLAAAVAEDGDDAADEIFPTVKLSKADAKMKEKFAKMKERHTKIVAERKEALQVATKNLEASVLFDKGMAATLRLQNALCEERVQNFYVQLSYFEQRRIMTTFNSDWIPYTWTEFQSFFGAHKAKKYWDQSEPLFKTSSCRSFVTKQMRHKYVQDYLVKYMILAKMGLNKSLILLIGSML